MKLQSINLLHTLKAISFIILLFIFACQPQAEKEVYQLNDDLPDEEADSVKIVQTNNAKIEYELYAVKIRKFKDTRKTFADTVDIIVYNEMMEVQSTLYSDLAEVDDIKNIIIAEGNVVVSNENGILKTPYLIWDRKTDEIFAKNGVEITRDNNVLIGEELNSDMNLERLTIKKVSATGTLDEEIVDW